MLKSFVQALRAAGLEPDGDDLADILWLADQITPRRIPAALAQPEVGAPAGLRQPAPETQPPTDPSPAPAAPARPTGPAAAPAAAGLYIAPERAAGGEGLVYRARGAAALPGKLAIGRALRPLLRRVPSANHFVLDVEATVERIADTGQWLPVMRPDRTRWLELDVIVDEWPSMALWRGLIRELLALLENLGAFRSVQVWSFWTAAEGKSVELHTGYGAAAAGLRPRPRGELVSIRGNRIVLLLSDCVSPAWYNGVMGQALADWCRSEMVALVQMLPYIHWRRTGLVNAAPLYLRAAAPGQPNRSLRWRRAPGWLGPLPKGLPLPTLGLETGLLGAWAQAAAGRNNIWVPGVMLPLDDALEQRRRARLAAANPAVQKTAQQLVEAYRKSASPPAWRLGCLLAATPALSLPVMRVVQSRMLPDSGPDHLAEFFLSGLIQRQSPSDSTAEVVRFEFLPGVRDELLAGLRRGEAADVFEQVTSFVNKDTGRSVEFSALLADPARAGSAGLSPEAAPFAGVAAGILRRLGGEYARLADQLEQRPAETPVEASTAPARPEQAATSGEPLAQEAASEASPEAAQAVSPVPTGPLQLRVLGGPPPRPVKAAKIQPRPARPAQDLLIPLEGQVISLGRMGTPPLAFAGVSNYHAALVLKDEGYVLSPDELEPEGFVSNTQLLRSGAQVRLPAAIRPNDTIFLGELELRVEARLEKKQPDPTRKWLVATRPGISANLRAGPGTNHPIISSVPAGAALELVAVTPDLPSRLAGQIAWLRVRTTSQVEGFISISNVAGLQEGAEIGPVYYILTNGLDFIIKGQPGASPVQQGAGASWQFEECLDPTSGLVFRVPFTNLNPDQPMEVAYRLPAALQTGVYRVECLVPDKDHLKAPTQFSLQSADGEQKASLVIHPANSPDAWLSLGEFALAATDLFVQTPVGTASTILAHSPLRLAWRSPLPAGPQLNAYEIDRLNEVYNLAGQASAAWQMLHWFNQFQLLIDAPLSKALRANSLAGFGTHLSNLDHLKESYPQMFDERAIPETKELIIQIRTQLEKAGEMNNMELFRDIVAQIEGSRIRREENLAANNAYDSVRWLVSKWLPELKSILEPDQSPNMNKIPTPSAGQLHDLGYLVDENLARFDEARTNAPNHYAKIHEDLVRLRAYVNQTPDLRIFKDCWSGISSAASQLAWDPESMSRLNQLASNLERSIASYHPPAIFTNFEALELELLQRIASELSPSVSLLSNLSFTLGQALQPPPP